MKRNKKEKSEGEQLWQTTKQKALAVQEITKAQKALKWKEIISTTKKKNVEMRYKEIPLLRGAKLKNTNIDSIEFNNFVK